MRVSFDWLKDYVELRMPPQALAEQLTMAGLEVTSLTKFEQDTILEIEVTPNRPDCLSIVGVAREVSAITGKKLKVPKITSFRGQSSAKVPIQIKAKSGCPRYLGRVIKNIKVGPSPDCLVHRLEEMGVLAVNNIVDITNFCLLEFGQPLHAFALDKLQGERIVVRFAASGEEIVTIDGVRRSLDPAMLVIADKFKPQAIAGIMGAKDSEVSLETTGILLESAYFRSENIHNTSRKLGLASQSSYRFERGVDLKGVLLGSLRATELIKKLACSPGRKSKAVAVGRLVDKGKKAASPDKVQLRYATLNQVLGAELAPGQITDILRRLQFSFSRRSKQALTVSVPSFRGDVSREADLVEEVIRLYGYDKIPSSAAQLTPNLSVGRLELASEEPYNIIRHILASLGLNEIMSYSLISRQALRRLEISAENVLTIKNPLSYEQEMLRPNLLTGMLSALLTNINRKNRDLQLFELSRVYLKQEGDSVEELTSLCIGIAGKKSENWLQKAGEFSFFDLKGIVEVLLDKLGVTEASFREGERPIFTSGRCALLQCGAKGLGFLGELKREVLERFGIACPVYACELSLDKLLRHIRREQRFIPLAKFPSIARDLSLIAPQEIRSAQIVSLINKMGRDLIAKITLFDQYSGEQIAPGCRGLAYSIEYRSPERTLTAEEVDKLHQQIRQALSKELKVQAR